MCSNVKKIVYKYKYIGMSLKMNGTRIGDTKWKEWEW